MTSEPYPSVDELLPLESLRILPENLSIDIATRYRDLGGKYLTDKLHDDGRRINGMMFTDRIENCLEEIIDGAFCIVGEIFKLKAAGMQVPHALNRILDLHCILYDQLKDYQEKSQWRT